MTALALATLLLLVEPARQATEKPIYSEPEFCALRVNILRPDGSPYEWLPALPLRLLDVTRGRVIAERRMWTGVTEFCDIPFGPLSLAIGGEGRQNLDIGPFSVLWGRTIEIKAIYPYYDFVHSDIPFAGCKGYFRVHDAEGRPIEGVLLTQGEDRRYRIKSDRYGRVSVVTPLREPMQFRLTAPGFREYEFNQPCDQIRHTELDITLTKQ